jgi:hypothetical protein
MHAVRFCTPDDSNSRVAELDKLIEGPPQSDDPMNTGKKRS